jgi:hypothetical protein
MRKYMWPNSCLPSATGLITAAHTSSQGRFTLEGVENHAARQYMLSTSSHLNLFFDSQIILELFASGEGD